MRKDAPLAVDIPSADRDRAPWVKVGVIAAVGFVLGLAWPRIVGVRIGPSAPGESASAAASGGARAPDAPPASVAGRVIPTPAVSVAPSAAAPPSKAAATPPQITVGRGNVVACKTAEGDAKKGKECGGIAGLDNLVQPRLKKLAACEAANGSTGKLTFVANADFSTNRFWYEVGKQSTVTNNDAVTNCLKAIFRGVSTNGIAHEHQRYTVTYVATLAPGAEAAVPSAAVSVAAGNPPPSEPSPKVEEPAPKPEAAAAGEAAVAWDLALVRDTPKTGQVVGRLPRGTKVKVGTMKDGWYSVKFGDDFETDGWVYRGAIGR